MQTAFLACVWACWPRGSHEEAALDWPQVRLGGRAGGREGGLTLPLALLASFLFVLSQKAPLSLLMRYTPYGCILIIVSD